MYKYINMYIIYIYTCICTHIPALSTAVLLPLVAPRLLTDDPLATFKGAYIKKSRRPA